MEKQAQTCIEQEQHINELHARLAAQQAAPPSSDLPPDEQAVFQNQLAERDAELEQLRRTADEKTVAMQDMSGMLSQLGELHKLKAEAVQSQKLVVQLQRELRAAQAQRGTPELLTTLT